MRKFWSWVKGDPGNRTLYLDGEIASETWWGDEITPKAFKEELNAGTGDITVRLNSPGGDVFAAAQIYTMLKEYPGRVTVKVDALAASAASVVAMAGDELHMSPTAFLMVHDPTTLTIGDEAEHDRAKGLLREVKESIINVYEAKTGLSRVKLSHMMNDETWLNAYKAVELGFADEIMFTDNQPSRNPPVGMMFSRMAVVNSLLNKLPGTPPVQTPTTNPADPGPPAPTPPEPAPPTPDPGPPVPTPTPPATQPGTTVESLYRRLNLLSHK